MFCTISAFSLYGEYVVRSFPPNSVFLPCDHELDFLTSGYVRTQSIKQTIMMTPATSNGDKILARSNQPENIQNLSV